MHPQTWPSGIEDLLSAAPVYRYLNIRTIRLSSWGLAATSPTNNFNIRTSLINISIFLKMKTLLSIGLLTLVVPLAVAQDKGYPDIPKNDIEIGEPIPMNPNDIPESCSAYEILVGMLSSFAYFVPTRLYSNCLTQPVARETSEPNYEGGDSKFGFIVREPIVKSVTRKTR